MASKSKAGVLPDPVALAQGHRWLRLAGWASLPAWLFGGGLLAWLEFLFFIEELGLALLLLAPISILTYLALRAPKMPKLERTSPRELELTIELSNLLARVENCTERLERGEDQAFDLEVTELALEFAQLDELSREHLRDRQVRTQRLQASVIELELGRRPEPQRYRALYQELVQFAAALRGHPAGSPYRGGGPLPSSELGLAWLRADAGRDRRLRRLAWWLRIAWVAIAAACVGLGVWLCESSYVHVYFRHHRLFLGDPPDYRLSWVEACHLVFDAEHVGVVALLIIGVLPFATIIATMITRYFARASLELSMPALSRAAVSGKHSRRFAITRAQVRVGRACRWVFVSVSAVTLNMLVGLIVNEVFDLGDAWSGTGMELEEFVMVMVMVGFMLVCVARISARLYESVTLGRILDSRDRDVAKHLAQLAALRARIDMHTPRSPLLELVAVELDASAGLGELTRADAALVRARVEAASACGPALSRRAARILSRDIETCEALISTCVGSEARR